MGCHKQPIASADWLAALLGALPVDTGSRYYDIGGTEIQTYGGLVATYVKVAGP